MPDEETKTRQQVIDDAIAAAEGSNQERDTPTVGIKGVLASDNPNKPGGALSRAWERKRKAGTLIAQQEK